MTKNKIILLVSGLVLFALIAWGTMSGAILEFETDVYKAIHRLPESMAGFFKAVTFFGNPKTIVLLLLGILIFNRKNGIYIVIAAVGSTLLNQILKYTFQRPRPEFEHLVHETGFSFPSGHSMIAISLYGFLLWLTLRNMKNKTAKTGLCAVFVSLMVLIPVSRIYLGVHFVGDVLGGMIIAGAYILFYIEIYKKRIGMKKPADVEK